jgi:hypothetical protein
VPGRIFRLKKLSATTYLWRIAKAPLSWLPHHRHTDSALAAVVAVFAEIDSLLGTQLYIFLKTFITTPFEKKPRSQAKNILLIFHFCYIILFYL